MKTLAFFVIALLSLVVTGRAAVVTAPATQAEVNAGTITAKFVSPATLAGWSGGGGGGGTNFSGQIITNFIRQVVLDTGNTTNIVIPWDSTNAVVSSPSNNFTVTLSGTPPAGFYQKIPWTLVVTNAATSSAVFPLSLPNGDAPGIRTPPSTNTFVIVSDGARQWVEGGINPINTNQFSSDGSSLKDGVTLTNVTLLTLPEGPAFVNSANVLISRSITNYSRFGPWEFIQAASINDQDWSSSATSGAVGYGGNLDTSAPGSYYLSSGTTSGNLSRFYLDAGSAAFAFGGGAWRAKFRTLITAVPNTNGSDGCDLSMGFRKATTTIDVTDLAYVWANTNSPYWRSRTGAASVYTTGTIVSNVPITTGWKTFEIYVNPSASFVEFYVDGIKFATNGSNIPSGIAQGTGFGFFNQKTGGATSFTNFVDYVDIEFYPTAKR